MSHQITAEITIATTPPAVVAQAARDGLINCAGWSSLWYRPCSKSFACSDDAGPQGSDKCNHARNEGWCLKLTEVEGA